MTLHPKNPDIVIYGDGQDIILARVSDGFIQQKLIGHSGYITCLACDADGLLASGSKDQTIRVWDLNQGATHIKMFQWPNNEYEEDEILVTGYIQYLAFSPSRMLVAGGRLTQERAANSNRNNQIDSTLCFWDLDSGVMKQRRHENSIEILAFNSDGILVTRSSDNYLRLWNLNNWETNGVIKLDRSIRSHFPTAFGSKGELALVIGDNIELWESNEQDFCRLAAFEFEEENVSCLAFGPDNILISGSVNGTISVWHISDEDLTLIETFKAHEKTVTNIQFNSTGVLISGSKEDRTIRQWNLKLKTEENYPTDFVINGSEEKNVAFCLETPEDFSEITKRISDSHQMIDSNNTYASINYINGNLVMTAGVLGTGPIADQFSDIPRLLSNAQDIIASRNNRGMIDLKLGNDGLIDLWYMKNQEVHYKVLRNSRIDELFGLFEMHRLSSSENDLIVAGAEDGTVFLALNPSFSKMPISSFERIKQLSELFDVSSLAFGPNGILASGQGDGTICIWWNPTSSDNYLRVKGHAIDFNYPFPNKTYITKGRSGSGTILRGKLGVRVTSLVFSSDGVLVSGSQDRTVRFWRRVGDSFVEFESFKEHTAPIECILFRADGCLITGSMNETFIWQTKDFNQKPHKISFGGSRFWLEGSLLWFSHEDKQYMIDLKDFPRKIDWRMATLPSTLLVNGCDITSASGLSFATQQLLEERGVMGKTFSGIIEPILQHQSDNQDLSLNNESTSEPTLDIGLPPVLSQYPGRLLNSDPVLTTVANNELKDEEKGQEKVKNRTCVIC